MAARALAKIKASGEAERVPTRPILRLPQGQIQAYVHELLGSAGRVLRPKEVQLKVEQRVGREVSYDTVASFLSVAARDPGQPIVRTGHGRYRYRLGR